MKTFNRHDASSLLVIDTHELRRRAGEMKVLSLVVPAPADVGIDLIWVPEGSPLTIDLKLESVVEGILVTGTASAYLVGECARCLVEIGFEETFDLAELYYYQGKDAEEDAYRVENDAIDLEPALRNAIVLDLPFAPLCRDECAGLCSVCGLNLNDGSLHSHDEPVDPRWENLAKLVNPDSE